MSAVENAVRRVLVVEDSGVIAEFLKEILDSDPRLRVIGVASDGDEAVEAVQRMKPDVVTMDIHMPKLNGFDATRHIMERCPTPIVIVTASATAEEAATSFRAVEVGALAVVSRPRGIGHPEHAVGVKQLQDTVRLMSEVRVVRRWPRLIVPPAPLAGPPRELPPLEPHAPVQLIAIGASTGGPLALQALLSQMPKDLPVPVLIVQHMAPGFAHGFVEWLSRVCNLRMSVARQSEFLHPGHVYVAPDDFHMGVAGGRILLSSRERENGLRPSASFLFRSVVHTYRQRAVGILLTGMGTDGAEELKQLHDAGAVTIAQDEESSVVHGMPGHAIKIGAAGMVLPPEGIARAVAALFCK
jgi:two-component system, chemotaxis family, protein-glutamate methylesterase/glutaminase